MLKILIFLVCVQAILGSSINGTASETHNHNHHHQHFHCNSVGTIQNEVKFKYYFSHPFKTNWFKAFQNCLNRGQNLLTIESSGKQSDVEFFITNQNLGNIFQDPRSGIWTSGTDNGLEGQYYWMTNGNGFNSFAQWSPGEPNGGSSENCVTMDNITGVAFKLNDVSCLYETYFICENKLNKLVDEIIDVEVNSFA